MTARADWLAQLEAFWEHARTAGWVQPVEYRAYDPVTDTRVAAGSGVPNVDAVVRAEVKRERVTPDGGRVLEITRRIHLRVSQMGGVVATKRGVIGLAGGAAYLVEAVEVASEGTRYACDCVRL